MQVTLATDPGTPGWPNEDFAAVAPGAAVLLDGCTTVPRTRDTGCRHGVAWYARTLGSALLGAITAAEAPPLADALAAAIGLVRASHETTCDLANPATPAATVTAVRVTPAGADLLALSDSVIAADYGPGRDPLVITDDHRPASVSPAAAGQARTSTLPLAGMCGIALLSDGATRITDRYAQLSWPGLLAVLRGPGPAELIGQVRAAEASDPDAVRWPRHKARDDATAIYWPQPPRAAGTGRGAAPGQIVESSASATAP
jgi:Protein phosphatase 2C